MVLYLRYVADTTKKHIEQLMLDDVVATHVVAFLRHLESHRALPGLRGRMCSIGWRSCEMLASKWPPGCEPNIPPKTRTSY